MDRKKSLYILISERISKLSGVLLDVKIVAAFTDRTLAENICKQKNERASQLSYKIVKTTLRQ